MAELNATFTTVPGVLTDEVGAISGEIELRTTCDDTGHFRATARYVDTTEWYTVTGAGCVLHDPRDHQVLHTLLVNILTRPHG